MMLCRFGEFQNEKPAIRHQDGSLLDVSAFGEDYNEAFFDSEGPSRLAEWLKDQNPPRIAENSRLSAPICRPSKIFCAGLNYADHAAQFNMDLPSEPMFAYKATSALCGANDPLVRPQDAQQLDWEVELAIVIGKRAKNVTESQASAHIAGYLAHNDLTERAWPLGEKARWLQAKSHDGFAPMGPFMALGEPPDCQITLALNGHVYQRAQTAKLIFAPRALVAYLSRYMTLLPGDVISTGSPAGVGYGENPKRFLRPGDTLTWGITGLSTAETPVVTRH